MGVRYHVTVEREYPAGSEAREFKIEIKREHVSPLLYRVSGGSEWGLTFRGRGEGGLERGGWNGRESGWTEGRRK